MPEKTEADKVPNRWKRRICGWLAAVLLLLPVCSQALETDTLLNLLLGEQEAAAQLELSGQFRTMETLDARRMDMLNRILGHLALRIDAGKTVSRITLLADREEMAGFLRKADAAGEKIVFSFRPDTVYTAEETGLFSAGGAEAEAGTDPEELFSGAALLHLALEEGYRLFAALPEQCGDRAKISALKKRVTGFGSAVDSVSITFTAEETESGLPGEILQKAAPKGIRGLVEQLHFRGRQRLTLLRDENGNPLMITYGGQAGTDPENLRDVKLEWRCMRADEAFRDRVTLKTPALRGTDRDNLTLERSLEKVTETPPKEKKQGKQKKGEPTPEPTAEPEPVQTEVYSLKAEYDRMRNKERTRGEVNCSLRWSEGEALTGKAQWTEKTADGTVKTEVQPEIRTGTDGVYAGTLEILRYSGKIVIEDLMITLRLSPGEEPAWPDTAAAAGARVTGKDDQGGPAEELLRELTRSFLRAAAGWPAEDLLFLSEGIPEEDWSRVLSGISE